MHLLYTHEQFNLVSRLVVFYGHFYCSVPDGFVLVLLRCIVCSIYLSAVDNRDEALREFRQWLAGELCFENSQLEEA